MSAAGVEVLGVASLDWDEEEGTDTFVSAAASVGWDEETGILLVAASVVFDEGTVNNNKIHQYKHWLPCIALSIS